MSVAQRLRNLQLMHPDQHLSAAARAFSLAAAEYDDHAIANPIIKRLRTRAQSRMVKHWHRGDHILELNCGTGADAVFLARQGIRVFATDAAQGMIDRTREHVEHEHLESFVHAEVIPFDSLSELAGKQFDGALSMFGGLNCAEDLGEVVQQVAALLRKDAVCIFSFIGKYSLWEMISSTVKGNVRKASRRWSANAINVAVHEIDVPTRYWSVGQLRKIFSPHFKIIRIESWSVISPLPSSTRFYRKHPRLSGLMFYLEESLAHWWPVNRWGDHVVLELKRI